MRIAPAVFTIGMSFSKWNLKSGAPPSFAGIANYTALLHDAVEDHAAELAPGGDREAAFAVFRGVKSNNSDQQRRLFLRE